MKPLEQAFASRTIRRIVLPGIIFTAGVHPVISGLLAQFGEVYGLKEAGLVLVIEIFFWGLVISSAINPIYYVYEGFRLPWVTAAARSANRKLVAKTAAELKRLWTPDTYQHLSTRDRERVALLYQTLKDFPLQRPTQGEEAAHFVERPTRLGNIIATYELYPRSRYNVDGVFYWHHLLSFAPAMVVAEFDDTYGFAESLLLTSFAGALVALSNAAIVLGFIVAAIFPALAIAHVSINELHALALVVFGLLVFGLFYYLALPAHRAAGKIFCTAVDLAIPQFEEWVEKMSPYPLEQEEKIDALHRYLARLQKSDTAPVQLSGRQRFGGRVMTLAAIALLWRALSRNSTRPKRPEDSV